MSLKSIELQVAIPRTFEAGKVQEKQQQREQIVYENTSAVQKDAEIKRNQINKNEKSSEAKLHHDKKDKKQQHDTKENQHREANKKEEKTEQHPYKGTFIDYSG